MGLTIVSVRCMTTNSGGGSSETVHSRVHVARVEATQPYSTDLLWDGDVLWIAVSRNHYLAYHPVREVAFETAWERFVSEYEE